MGEIKLSYVITTFNKLTYLKEVMRQLLQNVKPDEEIVIVDGASTDGTKEYLQTLYREGLIQQFVSEKDKGEAHGYNKALLLAKGELIKLISDDDVFNYVAIGKMKAFMLKNINIDAVCGNIISVNIIESPVYIEFRKSYQVWFEEWITGENKASFFSCLPLMIRKEKISLLGLFDTSYKHVDLEYSVRLTSQKRKLAFYSGIVAIGLVNEKSVSAQKSSYTTIFQSELLRLQGNFNYEHKKGLKMISVPWIRRAFFHRHTILWKFADKFNFFPIKKIFYPQYDIKLMGNIELPNTDIHQIFQFFERKLQGDELNFEPVEFICSEIIK
jgi:glycosyltransferase involved in cell wall biosynthesis